MSAHVSSPASSAPAASPSSGGAAGASSSPAEPSAVARAKPSKQPKNTSGGNEGEMSKREAKDFLKQRREKRKLRLAADAGEAIESNEPAAPQAEDAEGPLTADADAGAAGSEEQTATEKAPEKEPTWAQKLREDLSKKTERVKELEQREAQRSQQWERAVREVQWKIEDANDLASHYKGLADQMGEYLVKLGHLNQRELEYATRDLEMQTLRRKTERAAHAQKGEDTAAVKARATSKLEELRQALPELDWEKTPEARAWLQARFGKGGPGFAGIEEDAKIFAKALRFDRMQKAQAQPARALPPKPDESQRPASSTLAGAQAGGGVKKAAAVPQNKKESLAWLARRRASRS